MSKKKMRGIMIMLITMHMKRMGTKVLTHKQDSFSEQSFSRDGVAANLIDV